MSELSPDYVADKVIGAVLTNQQILFIPKSIYILVALKKLTHIFSLSLRKNSFNNTADFFILKIQHIESVLL